MVEQSQGYRKKMGQTVDRKLTGAYLSNDYLIWSHISSLAKTFQAGAMSEIRLILRIGNNILLRVYLRNGKRAGDLANLKLSEFNITKHAGTDHVAVVDKHKTRKRFHCMINLDRCPCYETTKNYITSVRPHCSPGQAGPDVEEVFVNTRAIPWFWHRG